MGDTIVIGIPTQNSASNEDQASVEIKEDANAPIFYGDNATHNTNVRKPKYSSWEYFPQETELYDLFMNKENGLMRNHPCVEPLTDTHYRKINEAYLLCSGLTCTPLGWSSSEESDPQLDRLAWIRFWVRQPLDNCKPPTISNY